MSLRPPSRFSGHSASEMLFDALGHEILAEKAAALGRAGERAEKAVARLRAHAGDEPGRVKLLKEAADAVYLFCSPESNYISGQVIVAGGGLLI